MKRLKRLCDSCKSYLPSNGRDGEDCRKQEGWSVMKKPGEECKDYESRIPSGLLVYGTVEDINAVVQTINPNYPRQNLENAGRECVYTIGGVHVMLHIREEQED